MSKHNSFFINLHMMCVRYGQSPSWYLFPDVECPHFRLLIDTLVFNIGEPEMEKSRWNRAAISAGAKITNL